MIFEDEGFGDRNIKVMIEGEEVSFTVAREDFRAVLKAYKSARDAGLIDPGAPGNNGTRDPVAGIAVYNFQLMSLIKSWKSLVSPNGKEVPCTDERKLRLFGKYPAALFEIGRQLEAAEEAEVKNSATSQPG